MIIIAIDGPAAGGKGTLSARIATHLGYGRLDSGKLYRATAAYLMENGQNPDDATMLATLPRRMCKKDVGITDWYGGGSPELSRDAYLCAGVTDDMVDGTGDMESNIHQMFLVDEILSTMVLTLVDW